MEFSTHFKNLAHAYLIQGDKVAAEKDLIAVLEEYHGVVPHSNPDFWAKQFATFTIEDARELRAAALRRKSGEGKRVFIMGVDLITREASNSMLKMLEEPAEDTHFFIIVPALIRVLPTISSRARSVVHGSERASALLSSEQFIKSSVPARMKMVKDILAQLDKDEVSKSDIASFIEMLIREQHQKGKVRFKHAEIASYASDQSVSSKMILEYLALSL